MINYVANPSLDAENLSFRGDIALCNSTPQIPEFHVSLHVPFMAPKLRLMAMRMALIKVIQNPVR